MRVLLLIDSLGAGGAERSTLDLCHFLKGKGIDVQVICIRRKDTGVQQEALETGIPVSFFKGRNLLSHVTQLNTIIKSFNPHVLHATLYKSRLRARLHKLVFAGRYKLVESLVTLPFTHTRITERKQTYARVFFHKFIESLLGVLAVDSFVAISNEVKFHVIHELFWQREEKIKVIYRGRAANQFLASRAELRKKYASELGFDEHAVVFIHIGRHDFPKNHVFLIKSFLTFLQIPRTRQAVLLCLGRQGEMTGEIQTALRDDPNAYAVKLLGHRHDVEQILAQTDIFLFPSKFEGLGGAVIEAKAASLPMVVANLPVFRELLDENIEAIFIDTNDPNKWAGAMKELMDNGPRRAEMGRSSLLSFAKKFSIGSVNDDMLRHYQNLLQP